VKAEKRRIPRTVVAVGTLAAEDRAELGFKVPGRLERLNVDLGSRVIAGAVLAELDARDYELRRDRARAALDTGARGWASGRGRRRRPRPAPGRVVRQARARLEQATVDLNRSRELRDQGILAQAAFDASEAAFKVAESLYNDSLEEVNNRRGILAERRSDLALAEQQLTDTHLTRRSREVQQRRANLGSTWRRSAGGHAREAARCACGWTCPSARRSTSARARGGGAHRGRRTPGPEGSCGCRRRSRGEPLADRRGGGGQLEGPAAPGSFARRDPDREWRRLARGAGVLAGALRRDRVHRERQGLERPVTSGGGAGRLSRSCRGSKPEIPSW
jgi:hypothetical protein